MLLTSTKKLITTPIEELLFSSQPSLNAFRLSMTISFRFSSLTKTLMLSKNCFLELWSSKSTCVLFSYKKFTLLIKPNFRNLLAKYLGFISLSIYKTVPLSTGLSKKLASSQMLLHKPKAT